MKSSTRAPVSRSSSAGAIGKTAYGDPAAAQTSAKRPSCRSIIAGSRSPGLILEQRRHAPDREAGDLLDLGPARHLDLLGAEQPPDRGQVGPPVAGDHRQRRAPSAITTSDFTIAPTAVPERLGGQLGGAGVLLEPHDPAGQSLLGQRALEPLDGAGHSAAQPALEPAQPPVQVGALVGVARRRRVGAGRAVQRGARRVSSAARA